MHIYDDECWWDDRVDYYDDPLACPRCEYALTVERYKYGEDADGRRGEWRTDVECDKCGWTAADGDDFDTCDECGKWMELCECDKEESTD